MKRLFSILAAVILTASVLAQPNQMSYQAVIRDVNNKLVTNQSIGMQVSIIEQYGPTPHVLYQETYSSNPKTNANGLVSISIGSGTPVTGTFSGINWTNGGVYSIKTEMDPTGGTNYTITGTSQLLSVPYALHANKADSVNYSNIIGNPALTPRTSSQFFTSNGTLTVPAGITTVWVTACGGGGGGGGGGSGGQFNGGNGGAGGSGMCVISYPITVVSGTNYSVTVGAGGANGSGGAEGNGVNGNNGGNSLFGNILVGTGGGAGTGGPGGANSTGPGATNGSGYASPLFNFGIGGVGGNGAFSGSAFGAAGTAGTSGFVLVEW